MFAPKQLSVLVGTVNYFGYHTAPTESKKCGISADTPSHSAKNCKIHLNKPFNPGKTDF